MDRITLKGLSVYGYHGVYDFERRKGQIFVVDVVLDLDLSAAAESDDVRDTVHYGELAEEIARIVEGEPVSLLEKLGARIVTACLRHEMVKAAEVTVHKPQAPIDREFADVSVAIRRSSPR
ncbi:dihydroneopterin aldolase [Saxibacter everestensis]|uniref:7,8-dihydroneopterin aldolase n=1 Tax=Saxibacter everestensis TaxID=2909229 RepID=A0ABY8QQ08_9MICO|nr:dihydroneopterin aldolase [Brevibacteriaceae bacterium ZFBP1038]